MKPFKRAVEKGRADTEHGSGRLGDLMDGAVTRTGLNRRTDCELSGLITEEEGEISRAHHHAFHPRMCIDRALGDQTAEVDARFQIVVQEGISETYRLVAERLRSAAEYREGQIEIDREVSACPFLLR